ncbi:MAG TPA: hypothetical protein VHQ00_16265 [Chloroflexota bacterium]|nr:hypothetical protein [Chloroflexota bacterium]
MSAPESPLAPPPGAGDLGSATIEPGGPVVAGSYGTWRLTFRCAGRGAGGGEEQGRLAGGGIATGGRVRLYTDSDTDWGRPQVHDPAGAEYLSVEGPPAAVLGLTVVDEKSLVVTVLGAPLAPGDAFTLTIGDRRGGGPGSRAQTFAEARRVFRLDVDPDGSGQRTPLPAPPHLAIVGGQAERLVLVAPSTVLPGEPFRLLVRAVDAWGNPAHSWAGTVTLRRAGGEGGLRLPQTAHDFGPQDGGVWWLEGCTVAAPGLYRLEARAELAGDKTLLARSNPVLCPQRPGPYRLYWGDPHGGQIADADKIPDFFRYARDVAGIDFAGYQRNDHVHSNQDYAAQQRAEREFAAPGRFVPLPGFEWSAEPPRGGHHNVYFRRHGQPMRRNSHRGLADTSDAAADLPHVRDLHRAYRGTDTLITPHVGGGHADLTYHEPTLEPALEISSTHGSFEWFFRESLARGYRMGVVGGSDSHDGRPGADTPGYQERRYAQGALTALLAEDLTLAGVHEALRARRCYATTGARILLHFGADGHHTGEAYRSGAAPTLAVDVTGTAPLESVTLFRGLDALYEHPLPRRLAGRRLRLLWEGASRETSYSGVIWDGELRLLGGGRGVGPQAGWPGGGRGRGPQASALGPPTRLRFDSPRSRVLEHSPTTLRWHSVTCGYRSGLEVDLLEPPTGGAGGAPGDAGGDVEAECVLRSALLTRPDFGGHGDRGPSRMAYTPAEAVTFRFRLGDVARRPLRLHLGDLHRSLTVSLAPAPGNPEAAQFTFVDPAPRPGLNPYWVRVVQEDQEMAWSSPIFVDFVAPDAPDPQ